jgi:hypothetical protein
VLCEPTELFEEEYKSLHLIIVPFPPLHQGRSANFLEQNAYLTAEAVEQTGDRTADESRLQVSFRFDFGV